MKYSLALVLAFSSLNIFAADFNNQFGLYPGGVYGPGIGVPYGVKYNPCISNLNMAINGYGFFYGESPIKVDENGKLVIQDKKIKSMKQNGNVKTIVYKSTNSFGGGDITHKIDITEEKGKIVHVTRYEDLAAAKKWEKEIKAMGQMGFPQITKTDLTFEHKDSGCTMTSSEMTEEKDGKEEIKVTHDKKLCDDIAPLLNQMGRQNAMQCAGLFSQVEDSYKSRNKEFLKLGKELQMANSFYGLGMSADPDFGSKSRDWTVLSVINNCMMTEGSIFPGMGFGVGMGYPGVGSNGGFGAGTLGPADGTGNIIR